MKDRDLDDAYCRLAKLVANGPDAAKSKDSIKSWATEYLRVSPKGACAGDMARFAQ